jgi:hypothetical protein
LLTILDDLNAKNFLTALRGSLIKKTPELTQTFGKDYSLSTVGAGQGVKAGISESTSYLSSQGQAFADACYAKKKELFKLVFSDDLNALYLEYVTIKKTDRFEKQTDLDVVISAIQAVDQGTGRQFGASSYVF